MQTQLRGNCQLCGRYQAVRNGTMAHHGYEVTNGYFKGVCQGHKYPAMQTERMMTDSAIHTAREDARRHDKMAVQFEASELFPAEAKSGNRITVEGKRWLVEEMVPYEQAPSHYQRLAVDSAISSNYRHAEMAREWANMMQVLVDAKHGQSLDVVPLHEKAKPIQAGEKKQAGGGRVLTAQVQSGAVVVYTYEHAKLGVTRSRMSSRSWRNLPDVA